MFRSTKAAVAIIAAVVALTTAGLLFGRDAILARFGGTVASAGTGQGEDAAAGRLSLVLDPAQFTGEVRKSYQAARDNPKLFSQLHCYCGCDISNGHQNLLDCYRGPHAATCEICVGEALEAQKLTQQGMPVEQIRDALRSRFAPGS